MAVQAGWVGSSAKAETGKEWMGDARVALRLPRAGWMSEMIGKSTEVLFINTVNRTQASIHALMGSPTEASNYIFENHATISAATQGGWALQTGAFPAGSTLTIINRGHIRGGGGDGGEYRAGRDGVGAAGAAGNGGAYGDGAAGGRGGYSVQTNGNAVIWIATGDLRGAVV